MKFYVFSIYDDHSERELANGWVRAWTFRAALSIIGHEDAELIPLPDGAGFPREAFGPIHWEKRDPSLLN